MQGSDALIFAHHKKGTRETIGLLSARPDATGTLIDLIAKEVKYRENASQEWKSKTYNFKSNRLKRQ